MIQEVRPGDTIRVNLPEYKGRFFTALSIYYNLIEVEVGLFVEANFIQKKYKNKYIPIILNS